MQWGPESIPPNAPYALSRGFVVYGSDSGHQTSGAGRGGDPPAGPPPPDWTANDEAFTNFAFAQMKKTHDVAVTLVAKFYGEAIRRSYYLGSSQGGREALIVVQRFPQDYDGVFAQVPAHALRASEHRRSAGAREVAGAATAGFRLPKWRSSARKSCASATLSTASKTGSSATTPPAIASSIPR